MNLGIIGNGGREHSLCFKLLKSSKVNKIFCIPGNSGISKVAKCFDFNPQEKNTIYKFCKKNKIDLVVVGPENLLEIGISDYLKKKIFSSFWSRKKSSQTRNVKIICKEIS